MCAADMTVPAADLTRLSIYDQYSDSTKITSHLDHVSHCTTSPVTIWLDRWTNRVFIMNTRRNYITTSHAMHGWVFANLTAHGEFTFCPEGHELNVRLNRRLNRLAGGDKKLFVRSCSTTPAGIPPHPLPKSLIPAPCTLNPYP